MEAGPNIPSHERTARWLLPFELACAVFIALLATIAGVLSLLRSVPVDLQSYAPIALLVLFLVAIVVWYRATGRSEGIALALMAAALYIAYSNVGVAFNYLLVPVGAETIDANLMELDRRLGFDWARAVALVEQAPLVSQFLRLVYVSSLAQLAAVILVLGFAERRHDLHRFLTCGILASMFCIIFWSFVPSIGPAAIIEIAASPGAVPRVVDAAYADAMRQLLAGGPGELKAHEMLGVVAMPSLHTVMMLMSVWYVRRTRILPVFATLNLPMVPAILVHGGHHLVDVIAGTVLFVVAAWASARAVSAMDQVHTASGGRLIRMASILPPVLRPNSVPRS